MYEYMNGKITEVESTYIVLEVSGIGYLINVANPYSYSLGEDTKVYVYQHIREDENTLYGFKTKEEKDLFLKLINVKGLGPKMALPMLGGSSIDGIKDAIERENILYLKKFPKIGDKVARQIILDLKGKLVNKDNIIDEDNELIEALKALGYKVPDIKKVLPKVDNSLSIEDKIKQSLKLLLQ